MLNTIAFRRYMSVTSLVITLASASLAQNPAGTYALGKDSLKQDGVPTGKVSKFQWTSSKIFEGTERDYWVYVPAQYDGSKPACVMVFQDGQGYVSEDGHSRVPTVFDNLIHQNAMPVTIGIFINPGVFPSVDGKKPRSNRSFEYDSLGDTYARFLLEEIIPRLVSNTN